MSVEEAGSQGRCSARQSLSTFPLAVPRPELAMQEACRAREVGGRVLPDGHAAGVQQRCAEQCATQGPYEGENDRSGPNVGVLLPFVATNGGVVVQEGLLGPQRRVILIGTAVKGAEGGERNRWDCKRRQGESSAVH